jgi:hypothetical protein
MARRLLSVAVGMVVGLALIAAPATAKSAAVTKIWFKLDDHEVTAGDEVTSTVLVLTKGRILWWPLGGAELIVSVDGVKVGTATTNFLGLARVSAPATVEGEHTMEVAYAGDADHKAARRSQGFTVLPGGPPLEGVPDAPFLDPVVSEAVMPGLNYLQWVAPGDNGSMITGYRVYRRTAGEPLEFLLAKGPAAFSADDTHVTSGTTYFYVVTAVNAVGESGPSNEVAITAR